MIASTYCATIQPPKKMAAMPQWGLFTGNEGSESVGNVVRGGVIDEGEVLLEPIARVSSPPQFMVEKSITSKDQKPSPVSVIDDLSSAFASSAFTSSAFAGSNYHHEESHLSGSILQGACRAAHGATTPVSLAKTASTDIFEFEDDETTTASVNTINSSVLAAASSRQSECEEKPSHSYNSIVMMGVDGAEVELRPSTGSDDPGEHLAPTITLSASVSPVKPHLDTLTLTTPRKGGDAAYLCVVKEESEAGSDHAQDGNWLRSSSLLDVEGSPAVAVAVADDCLSQQSTPAYASSNVCCANTGTLVCWKPEDDLNSSATLLQNRIAAFLASPIGPDDWCSGWQAWTYFEMGPHRSSSSARGQGGLKEQVRCILRNRAYNLHARSRRVKRLQREIDPFTLSPRCGASMHKPNKVRSFGSVPPAVTPPRLFKSSRANSSTPGTNDASSAWSSMLCAAGVKHDEASSPFVIRSRGVGKSDDESACYDSDPEETTRRRQAVFATLRDRAGISSWMNPSSEDSGLLADVQNEADVRHRVQEFLNDRFTLVWHASGKGESRKRTSPSPVAVTAWIERGQQLNRCLVQPKLIWKVTFRPEDAKVGPAFSANHAQGTYSCDLLDITRILEGNRVDRRHFPFAQRNKSFLVQAMDQKMLFQAVNQAERDRLVQGLKLAVSRLGSKIVVEDSTLFDEFFNNGESHFPGGELLDWARPVSPATSQEK